ncbi:MAG: hypothetical protein AEth_00089 [Candidatus Argoarchaeum ethanivorans]|uniref:Type I-D CRISPR-associated protein Cas7/Csc2 n=1 Tax=Candidatus Argoarchaeum ethanivorans TaxID=2608793 RepID=A0A8B3S762_9EURY|nr:MAG: hypothetical protein AEth_00089 [Candidatus Argoarchaeum ethanivorans]
MIKTDGLRSISVTYVTELLNEAPLNMNKTDGTQGRHKDAEVFEAKSDSRHLIRKLKRSGPAIKSHHSNALRDYFNVSIEKCSHESPCGKCWACWLHGMMIPGSSNIYTSITASDALSVEEKEIALTGLDENMLRARMGEESSPQPFGYERLRAGTHITGSMAINTGYRPSQEKTGDGWVQFIKEVSADNLRALFWYGVYCALTNEGYAQTAKTGQHNTRMKPTQLIAIETFKTPFPSCTRVDYSSTSVEDVISNHVSYANYITSDIGFDKQGVDGWSVLSKNGEERGRIKVMSGDDAYKFLIDQAEKIHTVQKTP